MDLLQPLDLLGLIQDIDVPRLVRGKAERVVHRVVLSLGLDVWGMRLQKYLAAG